MSDPTVSSAIELLLRGNPIPAGVIRSALRSGRVANAYLFKGPKGAPKDELAQTFARGLLCDSEDSHRTGEPCGSCWSCRAVSNHGHPDLIEMESEGSAIKIKASHEMLKEAMTRPYHSGRKVFIVHNAEDMTVEASNALLKVLEEPPSYVTFILTAENAGAIPETIVSRCQTIPLRKLSRDALVKILVSCNGVCTADAEEVALHADGDLGRALRMLSKSSEWSGVSLLTEIARQSPVEMAQKYSRLEPSRRVDALVDLEIELVKRLRERIWSGSDAASGHDGCQRELRLLYRSIESCRKAKERLRSNVNPFLTLSVLFMDLSHAHQEGD